MRCMGIAIKKNEIVYAIVEGNSKNDAIIHTIDKQIFRVESDTLMMDFSNIFVEIITKYKPDRVAYKLYLDAKIQQIPYMHYSLGILNLVCLQRGIKTQERSSQWITAGRKKKILEFEDFFSVNKLNSDEIAAALVAWNELGE